MYRLLISALFLAATPAWGGLIFSLDPSSSVSGLPGSTVGWGVTFTASDSNYYVLTNVEFCPQGTLPPNCTPTASGIGTFHDYASAVNGLIIGPGYSSNPYSETFSAPSMTGIGSFDINAGASLQTLNATINVYYDLYSGDPAGGGTQLPSGSASHAAQLQVGAASTSVPEPTSVTLILAGVAILGVGSWRKRRAP